MQKYTKRLLFMVLAGLTLLVPALSVGTTGAQGVRDSLCDGVSLSGGPGSGSGNCGSAEADSSGVVGIVEKVVNWLSWFVGIVSVIMIVVGGFKYITSGGDSSKVTGAKNTIIYAIIGLVIVALAQFIVRFVVANASELDSNSSGSSSPSSPSSGSQRAI